MKLLLWVPCEKVIYDAQSGHSLIAIFHGAIIKIVKQELPNNAVIPREWSVFTKWALEPSEEGKDYTSHVEILWPDGSKFTEFNAKAVPPTKNGMAFISRLNGFPIGQNGNVKIRQSLSSGDEVVYGPVEMDVLIDVTQDLDVDKLPTLN